MSWPPLLAGQNGGSALIGYTATAIAANTFTCDAAADAASCVLSGLRNGVEYRVSVTAANAIGSSEPSAEVTATPNARPTATNLLTTQTATLGTPFSFTLPTGAFNDDDGPTALTYSSAGQPAWFTFDGIETWSGTPDAVDNVGVTITVTAGDGLLEATDSFLIRVVAAPAFGEQPDDQGYTAALEIAALTLPPADSTHPAALTYTLHPTAGEVAANGDGTITPLPGLTFAPSRASCRGRRPPPKQPCCAIPPPMSTARSLR